MKTKAMVWIYSIDEPTPIVITKYMGQTVRTINYMITPCKEGDYRWKRLSVTLEPGIWTRDAIIDAIITQEYPRDRMEAVQNNYLKDQEDDSALEEMREMQEWRDFAKRTADELLALDPEGGVPDTE